MKSIHNYSKMSHSCVANTTAVYYIMLTDNSDLMKIIEINN